MKTYSFLYAKHLYCDVSTSSLSKHGIRFLTLPLHERNRPQNIDLVRLDNVPILHHFINHEMNLFELIHDIEFTDGSCPLVQALSRK